MVFRGDTVVGGKYIKGTSSTTFSIWWMTFRVTLLRTAVPRVEQQRLRTSSLSDHHCNTSYLLAECPIDFSVASSMLSLVREKLTRNINRWSPWQQTRAAQRLCDWLSWKTILFFYCNHALVQKNFNCYIRNGATASTSRFQLVWFRLLDFSWK